MTTVQLKYFHSFYACFCSEYKLCSRRSVIVMLYPLLIVLDIFLKNFSLPSWSCKFNLCQFTFFCHFDNKLLFQEREKRVSNHPTSFTWSLELLNPSCYLFVSNKPFDNYEKFRYIFRLNSIICFTKSVWIKKSNVLRCVRMVIIRR